MIRSISRARGRLRLGLVVLGAGALVAACTEPPAGANPSPALSAAADVPAPDLGTLPSLRLPDGTIGTLAALGPSANLIGLDQAAMRQLFGPPSLERTEGPAEVWQYAAHDCVMDAYLYAKTDERGLHKVAYVEFRDGGLGVLPEGTAREHCYAEVLTEGQRNASR